MKSYKEMIKWHVDQVLNGDLRYHEWPSISAIAHTFEIDIEQVYVDINQEKEYHKLCLKEKRQEEHRRSNEERRLANLEKAKIDRTKEVGVNLDWS